MKKYEAARINMVKNQVMPNKVFDKNLIETMMEVPRHLFVEESVEEVGYLDTRLPVGYDRFMLQPDVFARMVQAAEVSETDKILDIACGVGYSTAVFANIASYVIALENKPDLALKAASLLSKMGYKNLAVKTGELLEGAMENAPFDIIFINGYLQSDIAYLLSQLADNGRLIVIEKTESGMSHAVKYINIAGKIAKVELFEAVAEPL